MSTWYSVVKFFDRFDTIKSKRKVELEGWMDDVRMAAFFIGNWSNEKKELSRIAKSYKSVDEFIGNEDEEVPFWFKEGAEEVVKKTRTGLAINAEEFLSGVGKSQEEAMKMYHIADSQEDEEDEWEENVEKAIDKLIE